MLSRGTLYSRHVVSKFVHKTDTARNAIRSIFRDFDGGRPGAIDLGAGFYTIDAVTEGARRAGPHRLDDFVQPSAARRDEWLLPNMKDRSQPVGAESGVGADPAVIEYLNLLPLVGVAPVGNPLRVLGTGEARRSVGAIAKGLCGRLPTTAQLHLRLQSKLLAKPVPELVDIRDHIGAIEGNSYFRLRTRLHKY
jgi:hypothetical protein